MRGQNLIALVALPVLLLALAAPVCAQRYQQRSQDAGSATSQYYGSSGSAQSQGGYMGGSSTRPGSYLGGGYKGSGYVPNSTKPGMGRFGSGGLPKGYSGGPVTPPPGTPMRSSGFKMETMPGAIYPGQNDDRVLRGGSVPEMAAEVDRLAQKVLDAKARGDRPGTAQANAKMQQLLHQLTSSDPQNPKWKLLRAQTFIQQSGGIGYKSRSGTAGDQAGLKMAIRDLDAAMACPGAGQYASLAAQLKAQCQGEVKTRAAKSKEIQQRGARQFAEIYARPDVGGTHTCPGCYASKPNNGACPNCGLF